MADDVDDGKGPPVGAQAGTGRDRTPTPDPTVLTTQALYREVAGLRELIEQRIEGVLALNIEKDKRVQQLFDLAIHEREVQFENLRLVIEQRIDGVTGLEDEKSLRVSQQFDLVERQRVEQKKDTKDAVVAALTAQKEAVREQTSASERAIAKSETATLKQLEQLSLTFKTDIEAARRSIDEVKERIGQVDQKAEAISQQRLGAKDDRTGLYAAVAVLVTILGFALALYVATH